ncbi:Inner membrane protein YqjF [Cladophialophora carrionii]|uniref:Inner membrane protein YqjF n=1 Tax=Cladophialophora carrionii TaxID=86049 RepID=A0A1C1CW61_9EURO|nr:Inner membrane protein YqjF [Cladophialophora carrionii]
MNLSKHLFRAPARFLMSLLFILSGVSKLTSVAQTQQYMEAYGVPGMLIWPAAALEITGGTMVLTGTFTTPVSIVLSAWCLLTAAIFHKDLTDQTQMIMFLKNMAMAGGFLVLAERATEVWSPKAATGDAEESSRGLSHNIPP